MSDNHPTTSRPFLCKVHLSRQTEAAFPVSHGNSEVWQRLTSNKGKLRLKNRLTMSPTMLRFHGYTRLSAIPHLHLSPCTDFCCVWMELISLEHFTYLKTKCIFLKTKCTFLKTKFTFLNKMIVMVFCAKAKYITLCFKIVFI